MRSHNHHISLCVAQCALRVRLSLTSSRDDESAVLTTPQVICHWKLMYIRMERDHKKSPLRRRVDALSYGVRAPSLPVIQRTATPTPGRAQTRLRHQCRWASASLTLFAKDHVVVNQGVGRTRVPHLEGQSRGHYLYIIASVHKK